MRKNLDAVLLSAALLLCTSFIIAAARGVQRNSLEQHSHWVATKTKAEMPLMGSHAYVTEPQALSKNRLNLGVWYAFQEVIYDRAAELTSMSASVRFEPDGYINVLYDVRADGFSGVRLSSRADVPSLQFTATHDGEFTSTHPISVTDPVAHTVPHVVSIAFEGTHATATLDGKSIGQFERTPGPQKIGFRGGLKPTTVDDVELHLASGVTVREGFTNWRNVFPRAAAVFVATAVFFAFVGWFLSKRNPAAARTIALGSVVASFALLMVACAGYGYAYLAPKKYSTGKAAADETTQVVKRQTQRVDSIRAKYPPITGDSVYRILFLGSSQTLGTGAAKKNETWVRVLESKLNADAHGRRYEAVVAAAQGLTSARILELLRALPDVGAKSAVINLSNDDQDMSDFRANIDSIIATLRARNTKPILLLDFDSPEHKRGGTASADAGGQHNTILERHAVIIERGKALGIPVIDLDPLIQEKVKSGFFFWDVVHPTSYGHRAIAARLHDDLVPLLTAK